MVTMVKRLTVLIGISVLALLIASPVLAVDLPEATTRYATFITTTTARLNGFVDDDGGEACEVRFNYYAEGGAWDDNVTAWVAGYLTGESPYADVSALVEDTLYYYRVEIKNGAGTVEGDSVAFSAYNAPTMPRTWLSGPNVARWNATFIGPIVIICADSISMPYATVYFFIGFFVSLASGIGALLIGKRLIPALITFGVVMIIVSLIEILPMFLAFFGVVFIIGSIAMGHPREE